MNIKLNNRIDKLQNEILVLQAQIEENLTKVEQSADEILTKSLMVMKFKLYLNVICNSIIYSFY